MTIKVEAMFEAWYTATQSHRGLTDADKLQVKIIFYSGMIEILLNVRGKLPNPKLSADIQKMQFKAWFDAMREWNMELSQFFVELVVDAVQPAEPKAD